MKSIGFSCKKKLLKNKLGAKKNSVCQAALPSGNFFRTQKNLNVKIIPFKARFQNPGRNPITILIPLPLVYVHYPIKVPNFQNKVLYRSEISY
jgi:hypothetical protein